MTLLDEIQAKCTPELIASHDYQAIADAVNAGRTRVEKTLGGIGTVLETLGPVDGAALLDSLQSMTASVPALKWAWYLIERGELDFGSAATRGMIDQFVADGAMPAGVGALLKGVAEVPDPVSIHELTCAAQNDDGTWRI